MSPTIVSPAKVSPLYVYDQNLVQLCGAIDASSKQSSCTDQHQNLARCGEDGIAQVGERSLTDRHFPRRLFLFLTVLLLLSMDKEGAESVPASSNAPTVKSEEGREKCGLGGEKWIKVYLIQIWREDTAYNCKLIPKLPDRSRRQVFPLRTTDKRSAAQAEQWWHQWQTP